jgi:hypothetical protein
VSEWLVAVCDIHCKALKPQACEVCPVLPFLLSIVTELRSDSGGIE